MNFGIVGALLSAAFGSASIVGIRNGGLAEAATLAMWGILLIGAAARVRHRETPSKRLPPKTDR